MRLRTAALFLLLVTVLAPIVRYTDTLATYLLSSSASSGNNFIIEEASTLTFGGDIRPLNILPHESTTILKEQLGIVYSESSTQSLVNVSDASANDNARKTRQLTEDSVEHQPTLLSTLSSGAGDSQTVNENPIRQVTSTELKAQQSEEELNKPQFTGKTEIMNLHNDASKEMGTGSFEKSDAASGKMRDRGL